MLTYADVYCGEKKYTMEQKDSEQKKSGTFFYMDMD
jgi:hypothetical protein